MPQLIVGLDSADESANYIHILDVKENTDYYCPCCKGSIKPRAYKKDEKYKVQPHFYHESGGCSEESYVHYICKTWLFERGCQFKVDGISYTVADIETEKILNTKFGKYKPDIIVHTDQDKTFFFEIKYTNKKCDLYAPKWDELGIDVVEVDAREFVNNKYEEKIPEFKLIYSDGECFIKSYSRTDYEETIAIRKLEWKRQDKLNYKIQWERLDWFWSELVKYRHGNTSSKDLCKRFKSLDFTDMDFIMNILKRIKCINVLDDLIQIINSKFLSIVAQYDIYPYKDVKFIQESPMVFYIAFEIDNIDKTVFYYNSFFFKKKYKWYNMDLLCKFIESRSAALENTLFHTPYIEHIIELSKLRKLKHDVICRFYVNNRKYCYINNKFDNSLIYTDVNISNHELRGFIDFKYIYSSNNRINKTDQLKTDDNFIILSKKINMIRNRINNCKNNFWRCNKLFINNQHSKTDIEYFFSISFGYLPYKSSIDVEFNQKTNFLEIFNMTKMAMRKLISDNGTYYRHLVLKR